jgi:hypothetical protein
MVMDCLVVMDDGWYSVDVAILADTKHADTVVCTGMFLACRFKMQRVALFPLAITGW